MASCNLYLSASQYIIKLLGNFVHKLTMRSPLICKIKENKKEPNIKLDDLLKTLNKSISKICLNRNSSQIATIKYSVVVAFPIKNNEKGKIIINIKIKRL